MARPATDRVRRYLPRPWRRTAGGRGAVPVPKSMTAASRVGLVNISAISARVHTSPFLEAIRYYSRTRRCTRPATTVRVRGAAGARNGDDLNQ